jgi:hypothetical protein
MHAAALVRPRPHLLDLGIIRIGVDALPLRLVAVLAVVVVLVPVFFPIFLSSPPPSL